MSLWEKWEKEKMEKMGIKVKREDSARIYDMRPKANPWKQAGIVCGALLFCFAVYVAAVIFSGSRWSDTYIVRLFAERSRIREIQQENREAAKQQ